MLKIKFKIKDINFRLNLLNEIKIQCFISKENKLLLLANELQPTTVIQIKPAAIKSLREFFNLAFTKWLSVMVDFWWEKFMQGYFQKVL